ncbi:DUF1932 domain-containing protein [Actinomadura atramentaria]|uniref:DUF1932 domain-containing protein n=1 Tax=Actinomadura atramentaria TaxID=1990 RepID=UPI00037E429A|nr:DUF1932 domain-containing protein [Actinomadura atramentaria]
MTENPRPVVAVLGLGEAGGAFAADLAAAGADVRGYDPAVPASGGIRRARDEADAATGADLVLSVNLSAAAEDALRAGIGALGPGAVWADLNTASPEKKERLAALARDHGSPFADVAIMAPVPGRGLRVPMLASGDGAAAASRVLRSLGASVEELPGPAGLAATRKLLRSVFFKGMSAAIVEALAAARAAGHEATLRADIAAELARADAATLDRVVTGTHRHARRRADEMAAAAEMLHTLGVPNGMAAAARDLHERLAQSPTEESP